MKLTEQQARAVFSLIEGELDQDNHKAIREAKAFNKKLEADALEKFKQTEASTLLSS